MKGLIVDDTRLPSECSEWVDFDYGSVVWTIVRNYEDFVQAVQEEEFDYISFDHDLDHSSTFECIRANTNQEKFDYRRVKNKTGKHCAEFAKEYFGDNLPKYLVHSLNEQGRDNIIKILGEEKLVATHSLDLIYEKADEILKMRKTWSDKKND